MSKELDIVLEVSKFKILPLHYILFKTKKSNQIFFSSFSQSAGAVEYTDSFSAER